MVAIPFPLSTAPGEKPQEGSGRLVNCYVEPVMEGARSGGVWKRVPGLASFATTSQTGFRGMIESGGVVFAVFNNRVRQITSAGVDTDIAALSGSTGVFLARNNKAPTPDVVCVAGTDAFTITTGSVSSYPDGDVGSPNSVCFLDGYFFFTYGNGQCRASALNDTSINSLDVITAESNPDGLTRSIPFKGQLLLFGSDSCEFWSGANVNLTGFPFNRVVSTPYGLAGKYAIAGHEVGFGLALLWVSKDNGVYMLSDGYVPSKVSTPDLERLISAVSDKDTLVAYVYTSRGRPIWVLSSDTWTWELNIATMKWNERTSYLDVHWRGTRSAFCFNKWLCGDTESGNILEITDSVATEAGNPLVFSLESAPVHQFPNRTRIARVDVDVTTGVGIADGTEPIQTDPTIELSVARDCATFDPPRQVKLGAQARREKRVTANRFGLSGPQGFRLRIDVSDPVHVGVVGADVSPVLMVK